MELTKNFQHNAAEEKWYKHWNDSGYFTSVPDERPSYTVVIPPPNVTGVLHMGHALNDTVQDILVRRAKMQGYNTCWVPGTDHASIATEAKVVNMLKERGIDKNALSREEFLEYAWEWKEKYGGIILQQLKKLGCALDWNRTHFTMDDEYYAAVIRVFVDLYNKGQIYRGVKMINWDPKAKTALSDEEVIHKQTNSKLYYVRYKLDGDKEEYITIATVRPETILGDTAICVHPNDERYAHLKGRKCFVPLVNREIPIIFDDYIDIEFGTGALKVTPAHDINDYNLGQKHNLEVIDTLNDDGTLSEAAGMYVGQDRFVVRSPDWCISRQLSWGQRIPAWYDSENTIYVGKTEEEALEQYKKQKPELAAQKPELRQDEDVLDTWFSSWLWPMQVFGWNENPDNEELKYYYPTKTLVTAPEIIFFWVARMAMAGYEYLGQKPFDKVYFTGIVRDKQGRKMSKQLGNSPDLLALIEEHGADAVRFSVMISSPAGNDLLYDESSLEQGRNFSNKMWNALKLIKSWEGRTTKDVAIGEQQFAVDWMEQRVAKASQQIEELMKDFRLSEGLKTIYSLIWDDFCSWYLEWVKPAQEASMSQELYERTVATFEQLLQLLHPYMPFVTEEMYHLMNERKDGDDLILKQLPSFSTVNENLLKEGALLQQLITSVRDARNKNQLKP
ncbi:predicted protein, partial [Nematostella vectensis]